LGLLGFSSAGKCEGVVGGILTAFLQLEGDEVHHQPGLEDTEGNEGRDAENKGVEGATLPVDDLFFCGKLGQAVPKGYHGQNDRSQSGQNEEDVVKTINRPCYFTLVSVGEKPTGVENCLGEILEDKQTECHTSVGEHVSGSNKDQVQGGVADSCGHILSLDLLKVEFRVDMEPIGDLDNVEELEHEGHLVVRVAFPQLADAKKVLSHDDISSPQKTDNVEAQQLPTLVKLGMLDLGQVQLPIHTIQKVLLNDLMHDNSNQQVKENCGEILDTSGIIGDILDLSRCNLHGYRDIVMKRDEEGG